MSTLRNGVITALVALALVAGSTGSSHAQFVPYDDFEGERIDPERWFPSSIEGSNDAPTGEVVRAVEDGQLRLSLVSFGGTTSDNGTVLTRQSLNLKNLGAPWQPGFITGLKATVTVLAAKAKGCETNPEVTPGSRARAASSGNYFNDGTSTGPTDGTGDIGAFLQLQKDNDGASRIAAGIFRCTNPSCSTSATLASTVFTTTWTQFVPLPFKIAWQQAEGKFRVTANGEVRDLFYPVGLVAAGPPILNFKNVRVDNTVENCTSGRKKTKMDALFDSIEVRRQP